MALSHLINCILLVYAPLFIVYKAKNLYALCEYNNIGQTTAPTRSVWQQQEQVFSRHFARFSWWPAWACRYRKQLLINSSWFDMHLYYMAGSCSIHVQLNWLLWHLCATQAETKSSGWHVGQSAEHCHRMGLHGQHPDALVQFDTQCYVYFWFLSSIEDEFSETFILRSLYSNMDFVIIYNIRV